MRVRSVSEKAGRQDADQARNQIVLDHLPLVRAIAIRVHENLPVHVDLDDLIHAGGRYVDEEVAVDGNLITSRMPTDLPAFCREIARALAAQSVAHAAAFPN